MPTFNRLPPYDKCLHFIAGTVLALSVLFGSLAVSVLFVLAFAVGKEVADHFNPPHIADPWDSFATMIGACPVWLAWVLK